MSASLVQEKSGQLDKDAGPLGITLDSTPTEGNVLVAVVSLDDNSELVSSVTQTGVTWDGSAAAASHSRRGAEAWIGVVGSGASTSVSVAFDSKCSAIVRILEFSGLETSSIVDVTATNNGNSDNPATGNLTTTVANTLMIAIAGCSSSAYPSTAGPTNSFTGLSDLDHAGGESCDQFAAYREVTSTGTYSTDWTATVSNIWDCAIVALKVAGGDVNVGIPAGALTLTGYGPSPNETVPIAAGALTLTGYAPSPNETVPIAAGSLTLTGYAPSVTYGPATIAIPAGSLALTGYAVSVAYGPMTVAIGAGSLTLTGYAPSPNQTVPIAAGSLALTGYAPSSNETVPIAAGALTLTGYAVNVDAGASLTVSVPLGALTLTGYAPSPNETVPIAAGSLILAGYAVTVSTTADLTVPIPAGALTLTGYAPAVTGLNEAVPVGAGALILTGYAPTVVVTEPSASIFITFDGATPRVFDDAAAAAEPRMVADFVSAAPRIIIGADEAGSRIFIPTGDATPRVFKQ